MKTKYIILSIAFICLCSVLIIPKCIKYQVEQENATTTNFEPLKLSPEVVSVSQTARVSCYVDIGTMASGKQTYKGAVAVSDRTIKMGTKIYVEGFGEMTVEDRTNKRFENIEPITIDIWMSEKECKEFGLKYLTYKIM